MTSEDIVYHYTSIDTMMKIVETETIWASSVDYLNDTSEGKHYTGQIRERLSEYLRLNEIEDDLSAELSRHFDGTFPFTFRPLVASFSSEDDSLPQWRAYCPSGNGVAVGFSADCLKRAHVEDVGAPSHGLGINFGQVEYSQGSREPEVLDKEIDFLLANTDKLVRTAAEFVPDARLKRGFTFSVLLGVVAYLHKNISFSHESESRIVVNPGFQSKPLQYDFRTVPTTLVPFVKLKIPMGRSGFQGLEYGPRMGSRIHFIDRIVIGPTPHMQLSKQAIEAFFHKKEMNVLVEESNVPYRAW